MLQKLLENDKSESRESSGCDLQTKRSTYRFWVGEYKATKNAVTFE